MINFFLQKLIKITNQTSMIPFYHMVTDKEDTFANYLFLPRKINDFKTDLEVLLKHYQYVTLQELIKLKKEKKRNNKPVFHLTFDDGLANFYTIVAPILEKKNLTATVFVNTDFIDNKALFYRYKASLLIQFYEKSNVEIQSKFHDFFKGDKAIKKKLLAINYNNKHVLDELASIINFSFNDYLSKYKPYLSSSQIKDLIKRGFTIGAHSKDHPLFSDISTKEQIKQTKESLAFLIKNFDLDYKVFSFPFTDLNVKKDFFNLINKEISLDLSFGTSGIKKDLIENNLQRMFFEIGGKNAKKYLLKEYTKYLVKITLNKHIMPRN